MYFQRIVAVGLFLSATCGFAADSTPAHSSSQDSVQNQTPEIAQIATGNLAFEPVGPGDLIYLTVSGAPELSGSYRVDVNGQLILPLLTQGVPASGLNPAKVAQAVASELTREKLLVEPIVSVAVLDYRSRLLSVAGAVKLSGTFQALGNLKLLDALAKAQGLAPEAGSEIIVTRPHVGNTNRETLRIPVVDLLSGTDPALNIDLNGGEEIRVPEAPKIFVVGNVKMPGPYPLHEQDTSTVLKALALSQGTLSFTARFAYVYRVQPGSKTRLEIPIPLHKILHRESPDVELRANDILYVPENSKTRLSAAVLDRVASFGGTTASGLIIWH